MKVVVYEHVSGGGYAEQPIPPNVLAEGFAMLRCVAADFRAAGHEVTTLLDDRLSKLNPPLAAEHKISVEHARNYERVLFDAAMRSDATFIIAPETWRNLEATVRLTEQTRSRSLNSKSHAIIDVADKVTLYKQLQNDRFQIPKTLTFQTFGLTDIEQSIKRELSYPVVFKPADGTGCSGISLVKCEAEIPRAVAKIMAESASTYFVAQEYVSGESASVSLICNGKNAVAISLNAQNISLAKSIEESSYMGGCVPLEHPRRREAYALAEKTVELFTGLRGYVGVDIIFSGNQLFVVDVNARLTTSYVGLREVAGFNVAQAIVDAVVDGKLPSKPSISGAACFTKLQTPKPTMEEFRKAAQLAAVASPPFPLTDGLKGYALIVGHGDDLEDANLRLEEAKKQLLNIWS